MVTLYWARPVFRNTVCRLCGSHANREYIATYQHEPSDNGPWLPLCTSCRKPGQAAVDETARTAGFVLRAVEG